VGAWCKAADFGASVGSVWAGNLDLLSSRMVQAQEDDVSRVGGFPRAGKCQQ